MAREIAVVEKQRLTDGSIAYNVLFSFEGERHPFLRLACEDKDHANRLAQNLNDTAWAEILKAAA
jgi:hypothetical protein